LQFFTIAVFIIEAFFEVIILKIKLSAVNCTYCRKFDKTNLFQSQKRTCILKNLNTVLRKNLFSPPTMSQSFTGYLNRI